jgi:ABC-type multidrug transport system fused ATPase/permease subunit
MFTFFRQALSLLDPRQQKSVYLMMVTSAVAAIVQAVSILSLMPFIVLLTNPDLHRTNELLMRLYDALRVTSYHSFIAIVGLFAIVMLTAGNLFVAFEQWLSVRFLNRLGHDVRRRLLQRMIERSEQQVPLPSPAESRDLVMDQVDRAVDGVIGTGVSIFSSLSLAALIVAALLVINPKTTMIAFCGLLVAYLIVFVLLRRRIEDDGEKFTRLSSSFSVVVSELLDGLKEIRVNRAEQYFLRRFENIGRKKASLETHHSMIEFLPHYLLETLVFAGFIVVALYFLFETDDAGVSLSYIALYGMAVYRLVPALKGVFEGISTVHHNGDAVTTILRRLGAASSKEPSRHLGHLRSALTLSSVDFRYANSDRSQLNQIDLAIPVGSSMCLFGPSGSGKSTILNILVGLLTPQQGAVRCDDVAVDGATIDSWRTILGYAPQQTYMFADTLASNIAFGIEKDAIDMQRVIEVSQMANVHEFATTELPHGYESIMDEDGVSLSGGQRQRVGIARALYRNPQVLIFDESFANLDAVNRTQILDRLFALQDRTLIFSSHDVAVAARCNKVVVLEQGKIIAEGRYSSLLKDCPRFSELLSIIDRELGSSDRMARTAMQ